MAAELAGALRDGAECQVCGSTDHPRPASPADDAVTGQDQERAEHALLVAESALDVAVRAVQDAQRDYDALQEAAGGLSEADAAAVVQACGERLTDARAARAEHTSLEQDLQALRVEQDALSRRRADAAATAAGLRQSVAAHERTLAGVAAELDDVLGDSSGAVAPAVRELRETLRGLTAAQDALRELEDLTARADDLAAEARAVAEEQGFPDVRSVEHALLTDDDRDRLAARLRARADAEARAHAVLDDPELAAVEEPVEPEDVGDLSAGVATAEAAASEAARALALHEERAAALALHADRLRGAMEEWAPVRDQALRADAMSKLVRGMGQDNQLQMRLSAYVLATRLDQVVAAANERLGHMRDQRYLLRRTGRAERRSAQAGLGLEVLDQWTGDVRAPTTLSGGETFVVSLALALGLADVVTHESGGTEVETLFVDEGFGSLDADTLDDVMDRLDGLRAGGRTVGVVSHVTELRSRIPTQVQVDKGRAGSSITVGTLVG
jgi:DNA repair protein SbcC/Rad50